MKRPTAPRQFATPQVLLGTLALIFCVAEISVTLLRPLLFPGLPMPWRDFAAALLLTGFGASCAWGQVFGSWRRQLTTETQRINAALGSLADAVIIFNRGGEIASINPSAQRLFGFAQREIAGQGVELMLPGLATACAEARRDRVSPLRLEDLASEKAGRRNDGSCFPVEVSVGRLETEGGENFIALVRDMTGPRQLTSILEEQNDFLRSLLQQSSVPTFVLSPKHVVVIWNKACEELTGIPALQMLETDEPWKAFYARKRPVLADAVISGAHGKPPESIHGSGFVPEAMRAEGWYDDLNGLDRYLVFNATPVRNPQGVLLAVVETLEDLSDRKRYQEKLEYLANYDPLTCLPNRNLLCDRIRQALLLSRRSLQEVAVFVLDLDNFKLVNGALGQEGGDDLLKKVAARLEGCLRSGDTVAHQGGDEFTIVISDWAISNRATHIAAKILEEIARTFRMNGREVVVTGSIGISISPRDGEDVQTLLKNAEAAMYRAKEQGRNGYRFYTGEMNARSRDRVALEQNLRSALELDEFLVYYQPKVSLRTGRITGMEALVRWQSPELGLIGPDAFIPLAEETGLILPLGAWVLRSACAQNKAWQDAGLPALTVAVNLSPRQFRQHDIASLIAVTLATTGLEPRYLELEITESMVMREVDRVTAVLDELKHLGTSLSMDDFGTGYSSLSYLKKFPFNKLKIDQSFVRDITSDPDSAAIAKAVIAMAHSLRLKVIAEGVETQGQLEYLRSHGCDEMQGYYFSRPVPALEFERLLREGRRLPATALGECGPDNTLLVVDDDKGVTHALQRLLAPEGYRVLAANSPEDGFEMLSLNRVAVIVSDFRMPLMNGAEFLGRVKELHPNTVRIVLSGHADLDAVTDSINVGAIFKIMNKPWRDEEVKEQVGAAFRQYQKLYGKDQGPRGRELPDDADQGEC
jgi:diguanylate cyclase (GGDEF)-like protein/PAS domain S-box-containing protein